MHDNIVESKNDELYTRCANEIYEEAIKSHAVQQHHAVLFLGGQPGAGKSSFYNMDHNFTDYVVIDGDKYRTRHPMYNFISDHYPDKMATLTQPFVNFVVEYMIDRLSENGYNMIIEGTLRDPNVPINTCNKLKNRGYNADLYVIACDACVSWESTISRAKLMEEIGQKPRYVPLEKYNYIVEHLPESMKQIEQAGCFQNIVLLDRETKIQYHSQREEFKDMVPHQYLKNELNLEKWHEMYQSMNEKEMASNNRDENIVLEKRKHRKCR